MAALTPFEVVLIDSCHIRDGMGALMAEQLMRSNVRMIISGRKQKKIAS